METTDYQKTLDDFILRWRKKLENEEDDLEKLIDVAYVNAYQDLRLKQFGHYLPIEGNSSGK